MDEVIVDSPADDLCMYVWVRVWMGNIGQGVRLMVELASFSPAGMLAAATTTNSQVLCAHTQVPLTHTHT